MLQSEINNRQNRNMSVAIDNKTKGIQKILNIFSRSKPPSSSRKPSNNNEIDNLRTDAIGITQSNRRSSLELQRRQPHRNASLPTDLMSPPNLALHSQQFLNAGGGNVNNNYHFSGSKVHIGNNIQIIQTSSNQVNNIKKATKPNSSNENGINIEKPKRFSDERREIIEKLKNSATEITDEIINVASGNISPKNAKFIYRYLRIPESNIDVIENDNLLMHGSQEVIYKSLLHWQRSADDENRATVGVLIRALYKYKSDQCINELIKHFTENGTLSEYLKNQ